MKQGSPYPQSFAFCCPRVEQPARHWSPTQRRLSSPRSHTNMGLWHFLRKKVTVASQIWCPFKVLGFIAKIPRPKSRQFWGSWKSFIYQSRRHGRGKSQIRKRIRNKNLTFFSKNFRGVLLQWFPVHFVSYEKVKQHIQKTALLLGKASYSAFVWLLSKSLCKGIREGSAGLVCSWDYPAQEQTSIFNL